MSLLNHFNESFYQTIELCQSARVDEDILFAWQESGLFPASSFVIENKLQINSYLGITEHKEQIEYYPRGYLTWAQTLIKHKIESSTQAFMYFGNMYQQSLTQLVHGLPEAIITSFTEDLEESIQTSWQYFLVGKYGAICLTGKIDEIVAIDLFKYVISFLTEDFSLDILDKETRKILHIALRQLNNSVALDNPLLPKQLIRQRFIERLIKQYDLSVK
ncbi:DUF6058 family natural product biosynthesis protein [Pseudoalteromonas phenolica]|uniref:DUF6058 family natural product biosynthesis protein n=1 Tax=Pseudoalteromonas phenolica TaxID=161398 RepID=UPI00110A2680|nr:DUF6058 family natural product biosynthesis protein [Pseudoalteromonas phenolica]TMO55658.1 hypothetical protein CWC21_09430 [Pseudoalteromonas phenolica]